MPYDPDQDLRDWDREIVMDRERDARQVPFFAPRSSHCVQYFAVDDEWCLRCSSRVARGCAERAEIVIPESYPHCAYADECVDCAAECQRRKALFERLPAPGLPEPLPFIAPPLPPEGNRPVAEETA